VQKYLQLSDVNAYKVASSLSNHAWKLIATWDRFSKETIGKQFVRALDSISANLAEGFGRYTKKDKIRFYRYNFGSLTEALDWNEKAFNRNLLSEEEHDYVLKVLKTLPREINHLINFTNEKLTI